jgi:hypothetical protein
VEYSNSSKTTCEKIPSIELHPIHLSHQRLILRFEPCAQALDLFAVAAIDRHILCVSANRLSTEESFAITAALSALHVLLLKYGCCCGTIALGIYMIHSWLINGAHSASHACKIINTVAAGRSLN